MQQDYPYLAHNPQQDAVITDSFAVNTTGVNHYESIYQDCFLRLFLPAFFFLSARRKSIAW
jgi:hypothetical protein